MPPPHFDPENGQVYTESISYPWRGSQGLLWPHQSSVKSRHLHSVLRPKKGVPSLQDIAIISIIQNIQKLTPESLEAVPSFLGRMLWERIKKYKADSFHAWKCFAEVFASHCPEWMGHHYLGSEAHLISPQNIKIINGISFEHMVYLQLGAFDKSMCSMLFDLSNLAVLHLRSTLNSTDVTNADVTMWSDAAVRGAFPRLQQIRITNSTNALTPGILNLMPRFLMLQSLVLRRRNINVSAWEEHVKSFRAKDSSESAFFSSQAQTITDLLQEYRDLQYHICARYEISLGADTSVVLAGNDIDPMKRTPSLTISSHFQIAYSFNKDFHVIRRQFASGKMEPVQQHSNRMERQQPVEYIAGVSALPSRKRRRVQVDCKKVKSVQALLWEFD